MVICVVSRCERFKFKAMLLSKCSFKTMFVTNFKQGSQVVRSTLDPESPGMVTVARSGLKLKSLSRFQPSLLHPSPSISISWQLCCTIAFPHFKSANWPDIELIDLTAVFQILCQQSRLATQLTLLAEMRNSKYSR